MGEIMKGKTYKGRALELNQIENYNHVYLPDDYDLPCYRLFLNCDDYQPDECYYYMDIIVDENNIIKQIERYRDIYLTNSTFPLGK